MSSNSCTVRPVNDLKSNGFLDNLSYESKERTNGWRTDGHKAVCKQLCKRSIHIFIIIDDKKHRLLFKEREIYCTSARHLYFPLALD
jgi:hypothetical protein